MFEFKTEINGEPITLVLKDYGDVPGRVSRYNIGRVEAQMWASLEWGLVEPEHWPLESERSGSDIFNDLPQREIVRCFNKWQEAAMTP